MGKNLRFGILALIAIALGFGLFAECGDDPRGNIASFEDQPLQAGLADPSEALTVAMVDDPGTGPKAVLVVAMRGETLVGVDLSELGATAGLGPFAALASLERQVLLASFTDSALHRDYAFADLLPAGGTASINVATGTNFPEHAEEASSTGVFNFPKFGPATPARTTVVHQAGSLLDYEVELCVRFDRDIKTLEDFDAAMKGFFLCGDFTDRAALIRLIDPDNLDSGRGFSDGKSGPDFYPSGPFLVIPNDWRSFIASERMTTEINGVMRQDARGGEMTLDFRELAARALAEPRTRRFLYRGEYHDLMPQGYFTAGMSLMSGTSEGVIFTPPTACDIRAGIGEYLFGGHLLEGQAPMPVLIDTFIAREIASGHFLQPGDELRYNSSRLGNITVEVVGPRLSAAGIQAADISYASRSN
jgi:2-keto-4-pentenoate hydratase/2-oxohepta-3-ene-1,7-dioic acid hydratase in catechol pathway